jgi:hypothetical protein
VEGLDLVVHLELAVLWVFRALVELSVPPVIAVLLEVLDLVGYQVLVDLQDQLGPKGPPLRDPLGPDFVFHDEVDGEKQLRGVYYSKLIVPLLKRVQELTARVAQLESNA